MSLKFEPSDFNFAASFDRMGILDLESRKILADRMQAKFDKWLSEQPVVYTHEHPDEWYSRKDEKLDTHSARLVDIQNLKPKECEHEPMLVGREGECRLTLECNKCGIKLKAVWQPSDQA